MIETLRKFLGNEERNDCDGWQYLGVTNKTISKHEWTDGTETIQLHKDPYKPGDPWRAEVSGDNRDRTRILETSAATLLEGLIWVDLYMRDEEITGIMRRDMQASEAEWVGGLSDKE